MKVDKQKRHYLWTQKKKKEAEQTEHHRLQKLGLLKTNWGEK